jgi:hypothetical protein
VRVDLLPTNLSDSPRAAWLVFSRDGRRAAVAPVGAPTSTANAAGVPRADAASPGTISIVDTVSWREIQRIELSREGLAGMEFLPDGSGLYFGNSAGKVSLWDEKSGCVALTLPHMERFALSADGTRMLSYRPGQPLTVWAMPFGQLTTLTESAGADELRHVGGSRVLLLHYAGEGEKWRTEWRLWDWEQGRQLMHQRHSSLRDIPTSGL